jgi:lipid-binding SYLF domain-containing protein
MNTSLQNLRLSAIAVMLMASLTLASAAAAEHLTAAERTIVQYKETDPSLARFFERSAGYAVFSTVGKGGLGFGGAYGAGVLYEKGQVTGKVSLAQATIGLQVGGQTYSEIIFFETAEALNRFKRDQLAFSAQVSAVALESGASANVRFRDRVAVFTAPQRGLMFETSIGGQRFGYKAFPPRTADASR